jgi:hypothetical protein
MSYQFMPLRICSSYSLSLFKNGHPSCVTRSRRATVFSGQREKLGNVAGLEHRVFAAVLQDYSKVLQIFPVLSNPNIKVLKITRD